MLGNSAKASSTTGNVNEIAIGYDSTGKGSNTIMLGSSSITDVYNGADSAGFSQVSD